MPLPLGEVAERSEDGEGTQGGKALSVTYGDSSPKGRAKGVYAFWRKKWSVSVPIRSIRCFTTTIQNHAGLFYSVTLSWSRSARVIPSKNPSIILSSLSHIGLA